MADATNGGMLYHEVQESNLCAVHCLNALLQGPFFVETDLAAIAADVDREERRVMNQEGSELLGDFLTQDSHNVSTAGDFSIQVLERALSVWNLQVIPMNSNVDCHDPERESTFICHSHGHWFCIRNVNGELYNFNSLYAAPEHLSKFYLCAFLDTLRGSGWSVFLVRGNLPAECPITSSNSFGQWLTPEGARMITNAIRESQASQQGQDPDPRLTGEADAVVAMDQQHLHAAAVADTFIDSLRHASATREIQTKRDTSPSPEEAPTTESSKLEGPPEDGGVTEDSYAEFDPKLMAFLEMASGANQISDSVQVGVVDRDSGGSDDDTETALSDDDIAADLIHGTSARTSGGGGKSASAGF